MMYLKESFFKEEFEKLEPATKKSVLKEIRSRYPRPTEDDIVNYLVESDENLHKLNENHFFRDNR